MNSQGRLNAPHALQHDLRLYESPEADRLPKPMLRNNQEHNNCFSRAKARTTKMRPKPRGLERRLQALLGGRGIRHNLGLQYRPEGLPVFVPTNTIRT
jgi:hypothetical protein